MNLNRFLVWLLIGLWVVVSATALYFESGSHFQRAGAIGIASAIVLFANMKWRLSDQSEQIDKLNLEVRVARIENNVAQDVNAITSSINALVSVVNEFPKMIQTILSGSAEASAVADRCASRAAELDSVQGLLKEADMREKRFEDRIQVLVDSSRRLSFRVVVMEAVVLSSATLQTGYGDLLVPFFIEGL